MKKGEKVPLEELLLFEVEGIVLTTSTKFFTALTLSKL